MCQIGKINKLLTNMSIFKGTAISKYWQEHKGLLFYFSRRVKREQIQVVAGYLSYVCLMSLVPLMVVMLSVMTAFPLFAELQQNIEKFVYQNFVPAAGDVVFKHRDFAGLHFTGSTAVFQHLWKEIRRWDKQKIKR